MKTKISQPKTYQFSSVAQSCLTLCNPMECSTPASLSITSTGPCANSWPSSQWCHPNISSSVIPFSSCLQSFSASGSFPRSQFFASDGQSIGVSASASVLPINIQNWFLYDWLVWSPCSPRTLKSLLQQVSSKALILHCSAFFMVQLSHPDMTATSLHFTLLYWKNHGFD